MSAKILLISPYHGGSHRAWATGYQQYSQHQVQLLTLPARFGGADALKAMAGHVLAQGSYTGTYTLNPALR